MTFKRIPIVIEGEKKVALTQACANESFGPSGGRDEDSSEEEVSDPGTSGEDVDEVDGDDETTSGEDSDGDHEYVDTVPVKTKTPAKRRNPHPLEQIEARTTVEERRFGSFHDRRRKRDERNYRNPRLGMNHTRWEYRTSRTKARSLRIARTTTLESRTSRTKVISMQLRLYFHSVQSPASPKDCPLRNGKLA